MAGRFLLDTSVVIPLFKRDPLVERGLSVAEELYVPAIVLGELFYGAQGSGLPRASLAQVEAFGAANTLLDTDAETARHYGVIKDRLRRRGRPLPENDIWIAAVAVQHGLTLATRDKHFREIEALPLAEW